MERPERTSVPFPAGTEAVPRVSIIVPTYNRGTLLVEALDSVLAQTYTDFEVIVIDDGSTDPTSELVKPYLNRIVFKSQNNRGVAAARNHGLRWARGQYVCFLDSDDKWHPEKLATQVHFADAHPEYGLIATEIEGFDTNGPVPGRGKASMYEICDGFVLEKLLFSNWIQTSTAMIHRDCFDRVGCFDEDVGQFGEDWLMWMRIAASYPIFFIRTPLTLYRMHEDNLTSHKPELQYESLMTILDRLAAWPQFLAKPDLIHHARYRIALNRAKMNLRNGDFQLAHEKLNQARDLRPLTMRLVCIMMYCKVMRILHPARQQANAL